MRTNYSRVKLLFICILTAVVIPAMGQVQWSIETPEAVYDWDSRMLSDGSFVVYYNSPSQLIIYEDTVSAQEHILMRYNADGTSAWSEPLIVANAPNKGYTMYTKYLFVDDEDNIFLNIPDCRYDTFESLWPAGYYKWEKMTLNVYKISKDGEQLWGGNGLPIDRDGHVLIALCSAIMLEDSGLILSWLQEDLFGSSTVTTTKIARISSSGDILWVNDLSPSGHSATLVNGGSNQFIIVYMQGTSLSAVTPIYAQKLNSKGDLVWGPVMIYDKGGTPPRAAHLNIKVLPVKRGFFVSWYADPDGDNFEDVYCSYVNRSGDLAFAGGTSGTKLGYAPNIRQFSPVGIYDEDNEYVYYTWSEQSNGQTWSGIVGQKINLNGELMWDANGITVGPMLERRVEYQSVQLDSAGNPCFFYLQYTGGNMGYVQKLSTDGNMLWNTTFNETGADLITLPYANGQWIALWIMSSGTTVARVRAQNILDGSSGISVSEELTSSAKSQSNISFNVTRNPVFGGTSFIVKGLQGKRADISVYGATGKKVAAVFNGETVSDEQEFVWDIPALLPKGIYFATLRSGSDIKTLKIVVSNSR